MKRAIGSRLSASGLLTAFAAAGTFVLGGQLVGWATTACQTPNLSTKYCTDLNTPYEVQSCNEKDNGTAGGCTAVEMKERNQFPDGSVAASSGATKQGRADCYRYRSCEWDADTKKCNAAPATGANWVQGDKTVSNPDVTCPTNEG